MNAGDLELVQDYAKSCYDEFSEMLRSLLVLYVDNNDFCSRKLHDALSEEVAELAQYIRDNYEKIEKTEHIIQKSFLWKEKE